MFSRTSTRQQTQTYAGHFFLSLNLSIKLLYILSICFRFFFFYCIISVSVAGIAILVFCEGLASRSHFDNPWQDIQPTGKMSPSYWMELCICLQPVTTEVVVVVDAKLKKERSLGTLTSVSFYHHTMTRCLFTVPPLHIEDVEIQS